MNTVIENYKDFLSTADFEVLHTQKLGWIIIRTAYQFCSDPIKKMDSPEELKAYIESQIAVS